MNGELLRVGDKLRVVIEEDSRAWGYNPCPDGTEVEVVGFSEIHCGRNEGYRVPGIWQNKCWVNVRDINGKEWTEFSARLVGEIPPSRTPDPAIRLRDLPETEFYEGDIVSEPELCPSFGVQELTIRRIRFEWMNQKRNDGSPMPIYDLSPAEGVSTSSRDESRLKLVRRGNVWRYYHKQPLQFKGLKDEANFYKSLGATDEVKNPKSGLYKWTLEEALDAIRSGVAHGFSVGGLFNQNLISCHRFKDEALGSRVATETLLGFKDWRPDEL